MKPEHFDNFVPKATPENPENQTSALKQEGVELAQTVHPVGIGRLLILAQESPTPEKKANLYLKAGVALLNNKQYKFALEQFEHILAINPHHLEAQQKKALCLQGLDHDVIDSLNKTKRQWQLSQVFLFSGHLVDREGRNPPRFPDSKTAIAATKIEFALKEMGASSHDLALTQGACGGDLLFTEVCQKLGITVQWMQPFDEPEFIERSVVRGGEKWLQCYDTAKKQLTRPILSAPQTLDSPPSGLGEGYLYERCNLWLLYTALSYGIDKMRFICLWDGENGDKPGGTAHLYKEVQQRTGQVKHINTKLL